MLLLTGQFDTMFEDMHGIGMDHEVDEDTFMQQLNIKQCENEIICYQNVTSLSILLSPKAINNHCSVLNCGAFWDAQIPPGDWILHTVHVLITPTSIPSFIIISPCHAAQKNPHLSLRLPNMAGVLVCSI